MVSRLPDSRNRKKISTRGYSLWEEGSDKGVEGTGHGCGVDTGADAISGDLRLRGFVGQRPLVT